MLVSLDTDYHCLPLKQKERTPTRTRCFDIFFIFMCKIIFKTTNCTVKAYVLRNRVKQFNGSDEIGWMCANLPNLNYRLPRKTIVQP